LQERAELLTPEGGFLKNVPDVVFEPFFSPTRPSDDHEYLR